MNNKKKTAGKKQSKTEFSKLNLADCKQLFKEDFERLARNSSFAKVWADFAEIGAICAHQVAYYNPAMIPVGMEDNPFISRAREFLLPIDDDWRALESQYLTLAAEYKKEGMTVMAHLYGLTSYAVITYQSDFLGSLHEELDTSGRAQRQNKGEFFTPTHVAELMAEVTLPDVDKIIERNGFITVSEPCCGAGGMVIAVANVLKKKGYNPQEVLYVDATDINRTFFNLAYIQLSLLDIPALIRCGDVILLTQNECRETPQLKISRHYWEGQPEFQALKLMRDFKITK
ncbi:MAG: N-6 DNA methylase [Cyanobacteria bacterium J06649_11]